MDVKRYLYICCTIAVCSFSMILFSKLFTTITYAKGTIEQNITLHKEHSINIAKLQVNSVYQETKTQSASITTNRFSSQGRSAYLTFDDGPTSYTNDILDILQTHNLQATFFLLDGNINKFPKIVERIVTEGHAIGCHGVSHKIDKFYESAQSALQEINTCRESINTVTGVTSNLFRVPFGSYPHLKKSYKDALSNEGYIMWDWNIDSYDWKTGDPNVVIENIKKQILPFEDSSTSPVLLMHDKEVTSKALDSIITLLNEKEFTMERITESIQPVQFKEVK
ncbi:polysaccharide deacetylase family protein [Fredinandcohnia sp. 179-A 10B2 NHS]|uniref:polysaccharide deacetylase family protein n=1 Tax=Fredinandcohnia sp. 179-A 10B2 NHS TaxID=3235176 RepID=UPI0039A360D4